MSRTKRITRKPRQAFGEDYVELPEGLHRKQHHRCKCAWCLSMDRQKHLDREAMQTARKFQLGQTE